MLRLLYVHDRVERDIGRFRFRGERDMLQGYVLALGLPMSSPSGSCCSTSNAVNIAEMPYGASRTLVHRITSGKGVRIGIMSSSQTSPD